MTLFYIQNMIIHCMMLDKTYIFDRYSTSEDLSPILVPRQSRSLSRRSALSSRGRNAIRRKSLTTIEENRRHSNHNEQQQQQEEQEPIPAGGIKLYDRPVNMSEWVDLGNAMKEDSTMLSRVHDVEAQVWTQPTKPTKRRNMNLSPPPPPPPPHLEQSPPAVTNGKKQQQQQQRKSLKQSFTLSKQKSNKWMGGLFKKNESSSNDNDHSNKKSGLGSLITRSLSLKSSNSSKRKKQHHHHRLSTPPPPPPTTILPTMIKEGRERLPLHIERAIYHLSHVKLTNPKRPLHHQVMISNFMFWYLSIQQQQQQFILPPLPPQHHYQSVIQHGSLNMCSPQPC